MNTNQPIFSDKNNQESDSFLWDSFRNGDKQSYELIFNRFVKLLYRYGGKITPNRSLVEDCIQEIFIELWTKRNSIGYTTSIKFYLFAALRRKISRKLKKEYRAKDLLSKFQVIPFNIEFAFEHELIKEELTIIQKQKLEEALDRLSKREKEVVYLKYYENMSFLEISKILDIKLNSVYSLLGKAVAKLRKFTKKENK